MDTEKQTTDDAQHTPGPWEAGHYKTRPTVFWGRGNGTVPICACFDAASIGSGDANARLIAAAPELLKALRQLANYNNADPELYDGDDDGVLRRLMHAAGSAIARAGG